MVIKWHKIKAHNAARKRSRFKQCWWKRQARPASTATQSCEKGTQVHERSKADTLAKEQVSPELISTIAPDADGGNSGSGSMGETPLKRDVMINNVDS